MTGAMSLRTRRVTAWSLAGLALLLYLADLMGLKPPPRILPSLVLAVPFVTAAAIAGVLWVGTAVLGWQP